MNIHFLSDYFYTSSSSRLNWESIDGALLAHSEPCNNQIPALIFNETSFSVVTVPILIQSDYVLVFQVITHEKKKIIKLNFDLLSRSSLGEYSMSW